MSTLGPSVNVEAIRRQVEQQSAFVQRLRDQMSRVIVGQQYLLDRLLVAILANGHVLIEGVPGLAKTTAVKTLASAISCSFKRIQFTPDLMPADITGTEVLDEDPADGRRRPRFLRGPIFQNLLLADEINRAPPKTQSALLEAMQEGHVTAGGTSHPLPRPFLVLATRNPIDQEGTYPLPEGQLDRFMFLLHVDYPDGDDEVEIVRRTAGPGMPTIPPVVDRATLAAVAGSMVTARATSGSTTRSTRASAMLRRCSSAACTVALASGKRWASSRRRTCTFWKPSTPRPMAT